MSDETTQSPFRELATRLETLTLEAVALYAPVVECLIQSESTDSTEIEKVLDGLLGFCSHESALRLYRRLCRHYVAVDPVATVEYVCAYREMWGSDVSPEASV